MDQSELVKLYELPGSCMFGIFYIPFLPACTLTFCLTSLNDAVKFTTTLIERERRSQMPL